MSLNKYIDQLPEFTSTPTGSEYLPIRTGNITYKIKESKLGTPATFITLANWAALQTLINNSTLKQNYWYKIPDTYNGIVGTLYVKALENNSIGEVGLFNQTSIVKEYDQVLVDQTQSTTGGAIIYRQDKRGNRIWGETNISNFKWGNSAHNNNFVDYSAVLLTDSTMAASFDGNIVQTGSSCSIYNASSSYISSNLFDGNSIVEVNYMNGSFYQNKFYNGASINCGHSTSSSYTCDIFFNTLDNVSFSLALGSSKNIYSNIVKDSTITFSNLNTADVFKNNIQNEAILTIGNSNTGAFTNNVVNYTRISLPNSSSLTIDSCIFNADIVVALPSSGTILNKRLEPGYSNFTASISITGLSTINFTSTYNYVGKFTLTSGNATETVTTVSNMPTNHRFEIRPNTGLTLTLTGTAKASVAAGKIILPTASRVLNGTYNEYVEAESISSACFETNSNIYI